MTNTPRQQSLHEFFHEKSRTPNPPKTARKRRPIAARLQFDSQVSQNAPSIASTESDQSSQFSQSQPNLFPIPKCINFSPNATPPSASVKKTPPSQDTPLSYQFTPYSSLPPSQNFDNSQESHPSSLLYSQEELDFLTPRDQPVVQMSNPNSPSPMKKRHRLNTTRHYYPQHIRNPSAMENITQDMDVLDVATTTPEAHTHPTNQAPIPGHLADFKRRHLVHSLNKRTRSHLSNSDSKMRNTAPSSFLVIPEANTNPFHPEQKPEGKEKRKRSSKKRRPTLNGAALGQVVNLPVSRFLFDFIELEVIGSGSFSQVSKCLKRIDGWHYAVKKFKRHLRGEADRQHALREVYALAALGACPYVVQYYNSWIEDDILYIQLEYCRKGSVEKLQKELKGDPNQTSFPEEELRLILLHITTALEAMDRKQIVHLDVKPSNILLSDQNRYKLADFGNATKNDGSMDTIEGDNRYLSRELLEGNASDLHMGDIFALGATIYELALGETLPGQGDDWQRIRDGHLVTFPHYSNTLQHLIASMMHPDPLQRPRAEQILQHEALQIVSHRNLATIETAFHHQQEQLRKQVPQSRY